MADEIVDGGAPGNMLSAETGQLDERFLLWRAFCSQHSIPIETLPSDLKGDFKEHWEKLKEEELHKPAEGRT